MKYIFSIAVVLLISFSSFSQIFIRNSKWKGQFELPKKQTVQISFQKDTVTIISETAVELATLVFVQKNDSLLVRKISGKSSCKEGIQALYRIEWLENGEKFLLHKITDDCEERILSFTTEIPFERIPKMNEPYSK